MQDYQQFPNLLGRILPIPTPTRHLRTYSSSQTQLQPPPPVKCPRCDSTDTKFGYYNNYNLSQPRHFCKSCRRYWTKGGVLRNVPVGGGCRKNNNKRIKSKQAKSPSNLPGSGSSSESSEPAKNNPGSDPVQEVTPSQLFTEAVFNQSGFQFSDPGLVVGEPEPEADGGNNINGLDWGGCDGGLLFDVTGSGDPPVYWNQTSWGDTDPNSLFLP